MMCVQAGIGEERLWGFLLRSHAVRVGPPARQLPFYKTPADLRARKRPFFRATRLQCLRPHSVRAECIRTAVGHSTFEVCHH